MKAKQRPRVVDTSKPLTQRVNLQLSVDAYKRLGIYCTMEGTSPGETVTGLINEFLRAWNMPARNTAHDPARRTPAGPGAVDDRRTEGAEINPAICGEAA
jgi:hypothetical protein